MALHRTEVFMGLHCANMCMCETTAPNAAIKRDKNGGIRTRSQTRRLRHEEDLKQKTCSCQGDGAGFLSKTVQPKDSYAEFSLEYGRRRIWTTVFTVLLLNACLLWYTVSCMQTKLQWVLYVLGGLQPCLLLYYLNFVHVRSESIQAVSSIGVQLTTTYTTGRQQSHYYDMVEIQDVVINEVVTMHSVVFYLVLLIKDPSSGNLRRVIPVFKHSYPKLDFLVKVYNGVQDVLHPSLS
ncbi:uncharacterized protein LOC118419826 [Branchiostoma floridae]|uniref:Uncharacterized protein LOC118419826 n=1 Tax=Branchiostoma floridae TaxID=7739 RepID=A0A9J7LIG3_BRAFL|nr:uncharacterized protein LOC118419826 [Branchiostoma floridae]